MSLAIAEVASGDVVAWRAHAHVDRFKASDERDALHTLFPSRAKLAESAAKLGQLHRVPKILLPPHIEMAHMRSLGIDPYGTQDEPGNLLTTAGLTRLMSLLIAGGGQAYDHTHTAVGVGDTATAAAIGDTDLSATVNASNRYFQVADTSNPSVSAGVLTCIATFASANGNLHWQEWAIAGNTSSGANAATAPLLNHKVVDLGTKTSAAAWAFTVTLTIS